MNGSYKGPYFVRGYYTIVWKSSAQLPIQTPRFYVDSALSFWFGPRASRPTTCNHGRITSHAPRPSDTHSRSSPVGKRLNQRLVNSMATRTCTNSLYVPFLDRVYILCTMNTALIAVTYMYWIWHYAVRSWCIWGWFTDLVQPDAWKTYFPAWKPIWNSDKNRNIGFEATSNSNVICAVHSMLCPCDFCYKCPWFSNSNSNSDIDSDNRKYKDYVYGKC